MTTRATVAKTVNGVDVKQLHQSVESINAQPALAKFNFRLKNQWQSGGHNRSTVKDFYGTSQEITREKAFTLDADEHPVLLGFDQGPNPVEYLLHALAGCVTTSIAYHAAARGIEVEEVESSLEGDIDLRGFLGLDRNVNPGYDTIRFKVRIKADVSDEQLQEIAQFGPTFSPVFNSLTRGVPIAFSAERK